MSKKETAYLQLDETQNFGAFDVTRIFRALLRTEQPLARAIGQLRNPGLDVGINTERDNPLRSFRVKAVAQRVEHPVENTDGLGWFHANEFSAQGLRNQ